MIFLVTSCNPKTLLKPVKIIGPVATSCNQLQPVATQKLCLNQSGIMGPVATNVILMRMQKRLE
ncbi:MAG: hypothetical protein PHE87_09330 [Victivallaceae bacterium]|nr:hypothetical protein [Victivallaceae bacterium]